MYGALPWPRLASNALIGLVGNSLMLTTIVYAVIARFQCVNWISWKLERLSQGVNVDDFLASNALIGLVGNGGTGTLRSSGTSLASNALIGLVGNTPPPLRNVHKAGLASNALIGLVGNTDARRSPFPVS